MIKLIRTDSSHPDLPGLIELLDELIEGIDGDDHPFFAQFNKIDSIQNIVIAYSDSIPVGCGAFKKYSDKEAEIKRMFVIEEFRRKGVANLVLKELESWAHEQNFSECILETGRKFTPAVNFYKSAGYEIIPNYGQYAGIDLSVCMRKQLIVGS